MRFNNIKIRDIKINVDWEKVAGWFMALIPIIFVISFIVAAVNAIKRCSRYEDEVEEYVRNNIKEIDVGELVALDSIDPMLTLTGINTSGTRDKFFFMVSEENTGYGVTTRKKHLHIKPDTITPPRVSFYCPRIWRHKYSKSGDSTSSAFLSGNFYKIAYDEDRITIRIRRQDIPKYIKYTRGED